MRTPPFLRTWVSGALLGLISLFGGGRIAAADDALGLETLTKLKAATVFLKVGAGESAGSGSGFVIQVTPPAVFVVTNFHVVGDAAQPRVEAVFGSGTGKEEVAIAEVVSRDSRRDLAVLKVVNLKAPPTPIDLAGQPKLVETMPLYIFGFPLGEMLATNKGHPAITVGKGSVSSIRLKPSGEVATVQIDGDITPGNSGGPVVDAQGHLVGVAQATVRGRRIGFAIPAPLLNQLLQGRLVDHYFSMKRTGAGKLEVRVELGVFDPFNRLHDLGFYYQRGDQPAGKKLVGMPGVASVPLERQASQLVGTFTLDSAADTQTPVAFQATFKDGAERTFLTNARVHRFQLSRPARVVAATPAPTVEAPKPRMPVSRPRKVGSAAGNAADPLQPVGPMVTQANFNRVQPGMTVAMVHKLLGPPTRITPLGAFFIHTWQDAQTVVTIRFQNGRVVLKQGLGLK